MSAPGSLPPGAGATTGHTPDPLIDAILAPLRDLLRRYDDASTAIADVAAGIRAILASRQIGGGPGSPRQLRDVQPPVVGGDRPRRFVPAPSAVSDALQAFMEELSSLPGVQRVDRSEPGTSGPTLRVELRPEPPPPDFIASD